MRIHVVSLHREANNLYMKKLQCKNCGAGLFGAVNRCWKCGTAIERYMTDEIPPIRRSRVVLPEEVSVDQLQEQLVTTHQVLPFLLNFHLSDVTRGRFAIASVVLGVIACLLGFASAWAALLGIAAAISAVLGMPVEERRDQATLGLVLAMIAIFVGIGHVAFDLWIQRASQQMIDNWRNF